MSAQDRNTAITIAVILIVSTVSIIAVFSSLWSIIGPGVTNFFNFVGIQIHASTVDYNFTVPPKPEIPVASSSASSESSSSSSSGDIYENYSYNFAVPQRI